MSTCSRVGSETCLSKSAACRICGDGRELCADFEALCVGAMKLLKPLNDPVIRDRTRQTVTWSIGLRSHSIIFPHPGQPPALVDLSRFPAESAAPRAFSAR